MEHACAATLRLRLRAKMTRFLQYIVFFCTVFWSPQIGAW